MSVRRLASRALLTAAIVAVTVVGCVAASMPGPGPCNCESGSNLGCALADYLHEQRTVFICGGEARWGRLP